MTFMLALLRSVMRWLDLPGVRAPGKTCIACECSPEAVPILAEQLRAFGARVEFDDSWSGIVVSESGTLFFSHGYGMLVVIVQEDFGHFPKALLIGGIKQTIEEANEIVRRAHAVKFQTPMSAAENI